MSASIADDASRAPTTRQTLIVCVLDKNLNVRPKRPVGPNRETFRTGS